MRAKVVVVQETEGRKTRGGRGCVGAAEQLSGERTTRAGMDESKKTQTRQSPNSLFALPAGVDRTTATAAQIRSWRTCIQSSAHLMSGLAQGGLQKKAWRWQPEDGAAHCQFASPSSNQPTKPTTVVTHGNAISYSLRGTPRCCPPSSRVQLPGRRLNGPAKNTRSGAGSSINYTMECDGPFVVFHLECFPPGDARSNAVDRLPGFASGMGCSSRERKTKHNNPAMDSGFPSGPWVDDDSFNFGWKPMNPETHMMCWNPQQFA